MSDLKAKMHLPHCRSLQRSPRCPSWI